MLWKNTDQQPVRDSFGDFDDGEAEGGQVLGVVAALERGDQLRVFRTARYHLKQNRIVLNMMMMMEHDPSPRK